jgi:hypothetical protein
MYCNDISQFTGDVGFTINDPKDGASTDIPYPLEGPWLVLTSEVYSQGTPRSERRAHGEQTGRNPSHVKTVRRQAMCVMESYSP